MTGFGYALYIMVEEGILAHNFTVGCAAAAASVPAGILAAGLGACAMGAPGALAAVVWQSVVSDRPTSTSGVPPVLQKAPAVQTMEEKHQPSP